jgi:hypothetical protein
MNYAGGVYIADVADSAVGKVEDFALPNAGTPPMLAA